MLKDENHDYSQKYPMVQRTPTELSFIEMEVRHGEGVLRLDPNQAILGALAEDLPLGSPCVPSILSGEPGYLLRTNEVEIGLTKEELYRFFCKNLRPAEFFSLARKVGIFYELNGKFYEEDSGFAIDPQYGPAEEAERARVAHLPHLLVALHRDPVPEKDWSLRPHSIVSQYVANIIRHDQLIEGRVMHVLPLHPLPSEQPTRMKLFNNVVGVTITKDGVMRAYGPMDSFESESDLRRELPEGGTYLIGSVHSSAVPGDDW